MGRLSLTICLLVVVFFHVYKIDTIPNGLYRDEASIGVDAHLVATAGSDMHGESFPVYFESIGDWKNPIYVYVASAMFSVFGPGKAVLRATSAVFFLLALIAFVLSLRVIGLSLEAVVFGALALGLCPHYFAVSRVSFEVISQLSFASFSLLALCLISKKPERQTTGVVWFLIGLVLSLSIYTYTTARLTTPLTILFVYTVMVRKIGPFAKAAFLSGTLIGLLPFIGFYFTHPGVMTERFKGMSYLYDSSLGVADKIIVFLSEYARCFGSDFLLVQGDTNYRHGTGFCGTVEVIVIPLAVLGLWWSLRGRTSVPRDIVLFCLWSLLISPLGAALASQGPQALRAFLVSFYLVFFACLGLHQIHVSTRRAQSVGRVVNGVVLGLLIIQSALYLRDYFWLYAKASQPSFETAGLDELVARGCRRSDRVAVLANGVQQAHIDYLNLRLGGSCLVYKSEVPTDECFVTTTRREVKTRQNESVMFEGAYRMICPSKKR